MAARKPLFQTSVQEQPGTVSVASPRQALGLSKGDKRLFELFITILSKEGPLDLSGQKIKEYTSRFSKERQNRIRKFGGIGRLLCSDPRFSISQNFISIADPFNQSTVTPLKQSTVTPLKQSTVTPLKQNTLTQLKQSTVTPLKQSTVTPLKQSTVTPLKQSTVTPLKQSTVTPLKQSTVTPLMSIATPLMSIAPLKQDATPRGNPWKIDPPCKYNTSLSIDHTNSNLKPGANDFAPLLRNLISSNNRVRNNRHMSHSQKGNNKQIRLFGQDAHDSVQTERPGEPALADHDSSSDSSRVMSCQSTRFLGKVGGLQPMTQDINESLSVKPPQASYKTQVLDTEEEIVDQLSDKLYFPSAYGRTELDTASFASDFTLSRDQFVNSTLEDTIPKWSTHETNIPPDVADNVSTSQVPFKRWSPTKRLLVNSVNTGFSTNSSSLLPINSSEITGLRMNLSHTTGLPVNMSHSTGPPVNMSPARGLSVNISPARRLPVTMSHARGHPRYWSPSTGLPVNMSHTTGLPVSMSHTTGPNMSWSPLTGLPVSSLPIGFARNWLPITGLPMNWPTGSLKSSSPTGLIVNSTELPVKCLPTTGFTDSWPHTTGLSECESLTDLNQTWPPSKDLTQSWPPSTELTESYPPTGFIEYGSPSTDLTQSWPLSTSLTESWLPTTGLAESSSPTGLSESSSPTGLAESSSPTGLSESSSPTVLTRSSSPNGSAESSPPTVLPRSSPTVLPQSSPTVLPRSSPTVLPRSSPTVLPRSSPTVLTRSSPTVLTRSSPTVLTRSSPTVLTRSSPTVLTRSSPTVLTRSSPTVLTRSSPTVLTRSSPTGLTQTLPPTGLTQTLPPTGLIQTLPPTGLIQTLPPTGLIQTLPPTGLIQTLPPTGLIQTLPPTGLIQTLPPTGLIQTLPPTGLTQISSSTGLAENSSGLLELSLQTIPCEDWSPTRAPLETSPELPVSPPGLAVNKTPTPGLAALNSSPASRLAVKSSPISGPDIRSSPASELVVNSSPSPRLSANLSPTSELGRNFPPTSELPRNVSPTSELSRNVSPTSELPRNVSPTSELPRNVSPTSELPRNVSPTSELPRNVSPTSELPSNVSPTSELPRNVSPTSELSRNVSLPSGHPLNSLPVNVRTHQHAYLPQTCEPFLKEHIVNVNNFTSPDSNSTHASHTRESLFHPRQPADNNLDHSPSNDPWSTGKLQAINALCSLPNIINEISVILTDFKDRICALNIPTSSQNFVSAEYVQDRARTQVIPLNTALGLNNLSARNPNHVCSFRSVPGHNCQKYLLVHGKLDHQRAKHLKDAVKHVKDAATPLKDVAKLLKDVAKPLKDLAKPLKDVEIQTDRNGALHNERGITAAETQTDINEIVDSGKKFKAVKPRNPDTKETAHFARELKVLDNQTDTTETDNYKQLALQCILKNIHDINMSEYKDILTEHFARKYVVSNLQEQLKTAHDELDRVKSENADLQKQVVNLSDLLDRSEKAENEMRKSRNKGVNSRSHEF